MSLSGLKQKLMGAALAVVSVGCAAGAPALEPAADVAESEVARIPMTARARRSSAQLSSPGATRAPGFQGLSPPMGAPLDPSGGTALRPAAPRGWVWYEIEGAVCRDGSPTGFYVHFAAS